MIFFFFLKKVDILIGHTQRPDLSPPPMTLEFNYQGRVSPGYIFITPYEVKNPGPYIYDTDAVRIDHQVLFLFSFRVCDRSGLDSDLERSIEPDMERLGLGGARNDTWNAHLSIQGLEPLVFFPRPSRKGIF